MSDFLNSNFGYSMGIALGILVGVGFLAIAIPPAIWLWRLLFASRVTQPAGPNPPVAPTVSGSWNLGYWFVLLLKVVLTAAVIAIAFAVGRYLYTSFSGTTSALPTVTSLPWSFLDIDWITIALAVAALVAVGAGMWFFTDKPRLGTYVYVITLVLLVYWFYRYGFLNIPRTYLLYVLAGVGAVMVVSYVKGFSRVTFGILLGATFLMLGYSHHHTWNQFTDMLASIGWSGGGPSRKVASAGACSVSEQVPLNPNTVVDLNPQNCDLKLAYPNQCLSLRRADWTSDSTWYKVCDIPGRDTAAPNNIRYAYSSSPVVMFVQRRPH